MQATVDYVDFLLLHIVTGSCNQIAADPSCCTLLGFERLSSVQPPGCRVMVSHIELMLVDHTCVNCKNILAGEAAKELQSFVQATAAAVAVAPHVPMASLKCSGSKPGRKDVISL